jgi:ElaB/YqjD/DUF883 family membrane-anchored ribosome-binding protein
MAGKNDIDTSDLGKTFEGMRADISRLSEMITDLTKSQADQAAGKVQSAVSGVTDTLSDTAARMAKGGQAIASDAQEQLRSVGSELENQITRNPWAAILVAGAVGLMMGAASRRS